MEAYKTMGMGKKKFDTMMNQLNIEKTRCEKLLFYSFCCDRDKEKLSGQTEMTIHDFERITYLLDLLGFSEYCREVMEKHMDLLSELTNRIEVKPTEEMIIEEVATHTCWLYEFCNQLPSPKMKTYFKDIFKLPSYYHRVH